MNNPYKYVDRGGNKSIKLKVNSTKLIGKAINKVTKKVKPSVSSATGKMMGGIASKYLKEKQEEREKERIRQQFINAGIPADHPDLKFGVDLAYSIKKLCTLLLKPKISKEDEIRRRGEAISEAYEWYKSNYKPIIDTVNGVGRNNNSSSNDNLYGSKPLLYGATERVGTVYSASVLTGPKKLVESSFGFSFSENYMNEIRTAKMNMDMKLGLDYLGELYSGPISTSVNLLLSHFLDITRQTPNNSDYKFEFSVKQERKRADIFRYSQYLPVFSAYKTIVYGTAYKKNDIGEFKKYEIFTESNPYSISMTNGNYDNEFALATDAAEIIKKYGDHHNYSSALSQSISDKGINWKNISYYQVVAKGNFKNY